jgi:SpoVK/Ycf46/Vps4 family AAA+-type ATPase
MLAGYSSHLYRFAQLVARAHGGISDAEIEVLEQIWALISSERHSIGREEESSQGMRQAGSQGAGGLSLQAPKVVAPKKQPVEEVLEELDRLIGLTAVKQEVRALVDLLQVQRARVAHGLKDAKVSLHAVFVGPPGTGKTTVARLYGRILHSLGFLKKGQLIETDRAGLVAEYVGQTGPKVDSVVKSAEGGVLFIDEAYALRREGNQGDFGQEAIETLLKRMEDKRDSFVVIVAGYEDEMKQFLAMNPGLSSRFPTTVKFPHYECDELEQIFHLFAAQADYILSESATQKLKELCARASDSANRSFGNARAMRNLFEAALRAHAVRICRIENPSKADLETLQPEDIAG